MKMKTKGLLSVFITLFLASQAFAGWVMEEVTTRREGEKDTTIQYVQKNMVKSVDSETTMLDLEKGMIYFLIPEHKAYWSGTPEEWRKGMEEGQKQMEEAQLKKMTPEQRDAYKQYKKKMEEEAKKQTPKKKVKVDVKKTSGKATIAGYSGQKYQVWVDEKLKEELWICAKINPKDEIDLPKLVQLTKAMSGPEAEESYESSPEYMALLVEQGASLKTINYDEEGNKNYVTETVKVEKKNIPNSEFEVPKGYKKLSTAEFLREMMEEETE